MSIAYRAIVSSVAFKRGQAWPKAAKKALLSCAAMACLALVPLDAHAASKSDLDHHKKWWAWAEVGGFYDSEYDGELEVELFFPIAQSAYSLLFLDIEGELFANDMQDGAVALGYRQMFAEGWNLGVWAGPEVRRTREGNRFWRFDAGLELLHPDYDLRLNAYTPFTGAQAASLAILQGARHQPGEVVLEGNEIFMWNDFIGNGDGAEVPLWGFDGEVGVRVPLEMAGLDPNNAELRLYGGGFYFDADEAMEEIAGPKARVELRFYDVIPNLVGSRLTAEYEYSYDDVRGDRHQAGARFRIPFGSPRRSWVAASEGSKAFAMAPAQPLTRQERRMLDGLEREDIFTTRGKLEREQVGDYLTGVIFDRVAYTGPGDDLSEISAGQGDNTLIIVNGTIVTTETEDIQGVQTIQGGQSTIPVFGVRSGRVVDFTAPGAQAFIDRDNTLDGDVLALQGDHTHIAGLDINGNDTVGHGINVGDNKNAGPIAPGTWNIVIDQTAIHDLNSECVERISGVCIEHTGHGIRLGDNNAHVLIFNNTRIADVGGRGIQLSQNNSDVLIYDASIVNTGGAGIWVGLGDFRIPNSNNRDVRIMDTDIANTGLANDPLGLGNAGVTFTTNNSATVSNVTTDNTPGDGIILWRFNEIDISNVQISNAQFSGIGIRNENTVTIANARITDVALTDQRGDPSGIFVGGRNTVSITDTTIERSGLWGIFAIGLNTIGISNTTISDSASDALHFNGSNEVTISDSTIDGAGGVGLHLAVDRNTITMTNTTFTGAFGDDVIKIGFSATGNTLSGDGNVFNGTFGDQFCEVSGAQTGFFGFTVPVTTCP